MFFSDKLDDARQLADRAIDRMNQLSIPAHPGNYAVWYAYHNGGFVDLKRTIDEMLETRANFTEQCNMELFERTFGNGSIETFLRESSERLSVAIAQLMDYLGEARQSAADYGHSIEGLSGQLRVDSGVDEIQKIIGNILGETEKIAERQQFLERNLGESSRKIHELQEDLQKTRQEALTDVLTRLANRRGFDLQLRESIRYATETHEPLSLLMIDLDHFKKFNDLHGHQTGDQVLKLVAAIFNDNIKGRDTASRFGGEEFAIILPDTPLSGAVSVAESIRATVARHEIRNKRTGQGYGNITLSLGVAQWQADEDEADFVGRADLALYAAKRGGRNRTVSHQPDTDIVATAP